MDKITSTNEVDISISVISHKQAALIKNLLNDIEDYCLNLLIEVIITINTNEDIPFSANDYSYPIKILHNPIVLGFAANHNQALKQAQGHYFCVINPDIRLNDNPFPPLLKCLDDVSIGITAPIILNPYGDMDDSIRKFPTPLKILCKAFKKCQGNDYIVENKLVFPDWVGGMFLLFPRHIFEKLKGFNQRYFLYYEDVDICARLRLLGFSIAACPQAKVIHHAQRSSHRDLKYFRWHLASMLRFFLSPTYWQLKLTPSIHKEKYSC